MRTSLLGENKRCSGIYFQRKNPPWMDTKPRFKKKTIWTSDTFYGGARYQTIKEPASTQARAYVVNPRFHIGVRSNRRTSNLEERAPGTPLLSSNPADQNAQFSLKSGRALLCKKEHPHTVRNQPKQQTRENSQDNSSSR